MLACSIDFESILDVGTGPGVHATVLEKLGKQVTAIDFHSFSPTLISRIRTPEIIGDYMEIKFAKKFDAIWCCHVLEHQRNCGLFLSKLLSDLKDGGFLVLTVPPAKSEIVGGHLSLWNAGLLIYNIILSGNNCRNAIVKKYGYNISIITRKDIIIDMPKLSYGRGDLELLAPYFPLDVFQGFCGEIAELNWDGRIVN